MKAIFGDLLGKVLVDITGGVGDNEMVFTTEFGEKYMMWHDQNCCEDVRIEDIIGDIGCLLNTPILLVEEVSNKDENPEGVAAPDNQDSFTWTFYKLATVKGSVTIRWYGESNGYYSERVDFQRIE